jgi:hypothetical protein
VGDEHDRTRDRLQVAGEVRRVDGRSAQQVRRRNDREALVVQTLDHAVPRRGVSPVAVHEHDRRPSVLVSLRLGPRCSASAEREERDDKGEDGGDQESAPTRMRRFLGDHYCSLRK